MKILTFHDKYDPYYNKNHCVSLIVYYNQVSEVWLFNCEEGVQHTLIKCQTKLSLISKIFITDLNLRSISGLPGLLSTLSLDNHSRTLHIYGPKELFNYLKFNNKYSQTNFSYPVRIHNLQLHRTFFHTLYTIRVISFHETSQKLGYIISFRRILGKFNLSSAILFNLTRGPLYSKLKHQHSFITPDGNEVQGKLFSNIFRQGQKIIVTSNVENETILKELCWTAGSVIYTS